MQITILMLPGIYVIKDYDCDSVVLSEDHIKKLEFQYVDSSQYLQKTCALDERFPKWAVPPYPSVDTEEFYGPQWFQKD